MARMNLPIAVRCSDCKFWSSKDVLDSYRDTYGWDGWDEYTPAPDPSVGICTLAIHIKKAAPKAYQHPEGGFEGSMVVKDASDYMATLWTKDTHGCLAGVQKETNEDGNTHHPDGK